MKEKKMSLFHFYGSTVPTTHPNLFRTFYYYTMGAEI